MRTRGRGLVLAGFGLPSARYVEVKDGGELSVAVDRSALEVAVLKSGCVLVDAVLVVYMGENGAADWTVVGGFGGRLAGRTEAGVRNAGILGTGLDVEVAVYGVEVVAASVTQIVSVRLLGSRTNLENTYQ